MTKNEVLEAARNSTTVIDFDGETGIPNGRFDQDDDGTILACIVSGTDFSRWSDILDLQLQVKACGQEISDGNRDDPSYVYCGHSAGHGGEHGSWKA